MAWNTIIYSVSHICELAGTGWPRLDLALSCRLGPALFHKSLIFTWPVSHHHGYFLSSSWQIYKWITPPTCAHCKPLHDSCLLMFHGPKSKAQEVSFVCRRKKYKVLWVRSLKSWMWRGVRNLGQKVNLPYPPRGGFVDWLPQVVLVIQYHLCCFPVKRSPWPLSILAFHLVLVLICCVNYSPKERSRTVIPIHLLRENIWRVVFVLQFSSGCLALCQKYHSEKF